ncbi:MAG: ABC transporter ATP-binding protein [Rhodospirillaceae bacterium]|nr:ABC transporter ATP-binding protein [Rhodospirillaceae bacterium]
MARIVLDAIAHCYRGKARRMSDYALRPLNHVWDDGGAYALLGPSGCGKTTLLNVISGLITPSEGRIRFDDTDVTELPTQRRNIAQVFQFPVIYDTMTVGDNLAFPLRNRHLPEAQVRERVAEVAEMLDLSGDLNRRAKNLSADAKQKISLGRGLVRDDVAAILFDEPLTVIDPHVKWQLRRKLKEIHERLAPTLVYVTHDQNEALTFADRVVVMLDGQVLQVGTPVELFENPRHTFVGYFIGSPGINLIDCTLEGERAVFAGGSVALLPAQVRRVRERNVALKVGIRPRYLGVAAVPGVGTVAARVTDVEDLGTHRLVTLRLGDGGGELFAMVHEDAEVPAEMAHLSFPAERTKLFADELLVA